MKSIFLVDNDSVFKGKFTCVLKDKKIFRMVPEEENVKLADDEEGVEVTFAFTALNNRQNKELLQECVSIVDGAITMDGALFNDLRMRKVLKDWSLTYTNDNGDEEQLPLNDKTLDNLHPAISNSITTIINQVLGFSFA